MMVVEIVGGHVFGSMALVADGWHMSTHAAALGIAVLAYGLDGDHPVASDSELDVDFLTRDSTVESVASIQMERRHEPNLKARANEGLLLGADITSIDVISTCTKGVEDIVDGEPYRGSDQGNQANPTCQVVRDCDEPRID